MHFIIKNNSAYSCNIACKQVYSLDEIQQIRWATWTCVVGPEINGIWEKYGDVNDVNAADANFGNEVVATGDDFGIGSLLLLFFFILFIYSTRFHLYGYLLLMH